MTDFIEWSLHLWGKTLVVVMVVMLWGCLIALVIRGIIELVKLVQQKVQGR